MSSTNQVAATNGHVAAKLGGSGGLCHACRRPADRKTSACKLHVILFHASDDLRELCVSRDKDMVNLELTEAGLNAFQEAITVWRDGGDDFGLSPNWTTKAQRKSLGSKDLSSGELWFWGPSYDGP